MNNPQELSNIFMGYLKGPSAWNNAPRPNGDEWVFVRSKNLPNNSCLDQTSHLVNKLVLGSDYEWAYIKK